MITSAKNQQLKNIALLQKKGKARREQGLFIAEGKKLFSETPREWLRGVYVAESFLKEEKQTARELEELPEGVVCETVADAAFAAVSDTVTPQGILCLVQLPRYGLAQLLRGERTQLLVLEDIRDPGNLGTMLRAGEGAGITGVILNETCADLFQPKTVRSTMRSIYRVPYYVSGDLCGTVRELRAQGVRVYAAHLKGSVRYDAPDYTGASAFLIGSESAGLTEELASLANQRIRIPLQGKVESLNAAVSAAVLMYEVSRQRAAQ